MKKANKKIILSTLITASALGLSSVAFAQTTPAPAPAPTPDPFTNQMNQLSQEMQNLMGQQFSSIQTELKQLFKKGFELVHQQNYQIDPNLPQIMAANTVTPAQLTANNAQLLTQSNIDNSLKQFIYATRPYSSTSDTLRRLQAPALEATVYNPQNNELSQVSYHQYMQENSLAVLSGIQPNPSAQITTTNNITAGFGNSQTGTELPVYAADDTLYAGDAAKNALASDPNKSRYIQQPTQRNNTMFNFAAMFTPVSYTPAQLQNANDYLKFATQDSLNMLPESEFPFSQLTKGKLSQPEQAEERAKAIYYLKENPAYQSFMLNMRTFLALRSMSSSFLNQMIAERTPVTGLGKEAGLTDAQGNPIQNASPLQVEAYIANHRAESKSWYQSVENASPATVQRNTLIVLAEIERQNYQAHLDRERLLAAITAMNMNMQHQAMETYLQMASQNVKAAITDAIAKAQGQPQNTGSTSTTPATPKFKASTDTTSSEENQNNQ